MKAGRELDALIAEKVMGWTWLRHAVMVQEEPKTSGKWRREWHRSLFIPGHEVKPYTEPSGEISYVLANGGEQICGMNAPAYSTDISAAWKVVEKMREMAWSFRYGNNGCTKNQHAAGFAEGFRGLGANILTGDYIEADGAVDVADTAPLAICRAALKALNVEVQP